jgi:hypothetical protein
MRLASAPAPDSSLPRVLIVPQPVSQIELANTAHLSHVNDVRIVFSCRHALMSSSPTP